MSMTDTEKWAEWKAARANDLTRIAALIVAGHNKHCAYRQVWGDGICTCHMGKKEKGESIDKDA